MGTSTVEVVGLATITVGNMLLVTTKQTTEPEVSRVYPCVIWKYKESKCHVATCASIGLQMTGLDEMDATVALADALENLALDNDFDFDLIAYECPPNDVARNAYIRERMRFTPKKFCRYRAIWPPPRDYFYNLFSDSA